MIVANLTNDRTIPATHDRPRARWICTAGRRLAGVVLVLSCLTSAAHAQDAGRGARTAEYWKAALTTCQDGLPSDSASVDAKVAALRKIARAVDGLSARGVDPDAVEVTDKIVHLLRRVADYLNDYGEPQRGFLNGARDGLNNNPMRCINEQAAIKQEKTALGEAASATRKRLEAKYNLDLPALTE